MSKEGASLGDRMKDYESHYTNQRIMSLVPMIARMDGRAFHSFCRKLPKPFCSDFVTAMNQTCLDLVNETNADLGYVQSDEITLVFLNETYGSESLFGGKVFKQIAYLATQTTTFFQKNMSVNQRRLVEMKNPTFDARVFSVPNLHEAMNAVLWRILDAERNSVQALGQANFSHKELQNLSCKKIITKLENEKGIVWGNLPPRLKSGALYRKVLKSVSFSDEERERLPEKHVAKHDPDYVYMRSFTEEMEIPSNFKDRTDKLQLLFR